MKVIEILKIGQNLLEMLQDSRIKISDVQYINLYDEYLSITKNGGKSSYAAAYLSDKYHISERQVYYLVKKLKKECKFRACE